MKECMHSSWGGYEGSAGEDRDIKMIKIHWDILYETQWFNKKNFNKNIYIFLNYTFQIYAVYCVLFILQ